MDSSKSEIAHDVPPYLTVYKDGTIQRHFGEEIAPASLDPATGTLSKDLLIVPETGVHARLYRPNISTDQRLPLVVYFHGGAFCISSAFDPKYHHSLNKLVAESNIIIVSVNYRLAPEHPLPAAFQDSWAALHWVASHASGGGSEAWLSAVDFSKVFLAGDSAGATISYHMAIRVADPDHNIGLKVHGILMIHPYFWGKEPIGSEVTDTARKAMVDTWWEFVCPSDKGHDDPLINPFADGAPNVTVLGCERIIVCVAEMDILRDRGRDYYERVVKSGWKGVAEMVEVEGEDHVFHILNPDGEKAVNMIKRLATFINQ
ncbi:hypothetical protein LguiA_006669 [Lonicera macranthoides]